MKYVTHSHPTLPEISTVSITHLLCLNSLFHPGTVILPYRAPIAGSTLRSDRRGTLEVKGSRLKVKGEKRRIQILICQTGFTGLT